MKTGAWRRRGLVAVLAGGCLLAGPCGITTLQLQDFLASTLIRTGVGAMAGVVEAAIVDAAQGSESGGP